jgi:diguanylate cyclase (GGDEF)-like protein
LDFRRLKYYRHNLLILVTSGDRELVSAIAQTLESGKYNFITASNGEEAWQMILEKKPTIILSDWATPDVSGLALCHRVKASIDHPELIATYFVLIVDALNQQQCQIGLDTGVDELLSKPIDHSELKTRLRTGLRVSALMQSLTWANQRLLAQNDLLEALTLSDPLTKVLSIQAFSGIMPKMMQQFKGFGNYKSFSFLSVLIIDIDNFQRINQSYGEQIGNETIKAIAGRLSHSCVANSLIYRHRSDQFVCVTPHHDAESGVELSQNLLASIRSHPIAVSSGLLFPMTVSIGGVVIALNNARNDRPPQIVSPNFEELVEIAGRSLLQAQKSGGDRDLIEQIL